MRYLKIILKLLVIVAISWGFLTLWVQQQRPAGVQEFIPDQTLGRVLVVYNPDPIYDLDCQMAASFAKGLSQQGYEVTVCDYYTAQSLSLPDYQLLGIVSNTYNWAPDRPTRRFLKEAAGLKDLPVVAITLGSGDTRRSQRLLREALVNRGAEVWASEAYWLLRPNDASQEGISNTAAAREASVNLGLRVGQLLQADRSKI